MLTFLEKFKKICAFVIEDQITRERRSEKNQEYYHVPGNPIENYQDRK